MESLRTKSVLVVDNGLFCEIAPRLARDFGQVLYFQPWHSAYPKACGAHVGFGLTGVERVTTFWDYVPDVDIVVFPDLYYADWQDVVTNRFHKPCWGHRAAESLELDRWGTRKLQERLGIPAPPTRFIVGTDKLERYLKTTKNQWVKISTYRGDGETWHHETPHTTGTYLDHFRNRVGALAEEYEFMIEDHIEGIEIGYDGYTVRGEWPDGAYWGFEVKDKGYTGKFAPYADLPKQIRFLNDKLSPILAREGSVGFCSFEFRINGDEKPYMIDPCMRACSPPFEGTLEGYDNLSEIVWEGAHGRLAAPKALGEYVAMAMIHSMFALTNWVPIDVPEDIRRWVKLRNPAVINGKLYHVPVGGEMPEIGAVIAVSDDLKEAKRLVKERAEKVKGFTLDIHIEALDAADEEIAKAKKYGVDFDA